MLPIVCILDAHLQQSQRALSQVRCFGDDNPSGGANGLWTLPPGMIPSGRIAEQVATTDYMSMILLDNGDVMCWGWQFYCGADTQKGDTNRSWSGKVPLSGPATYISGGTYHACGVVSGGALECWVTIIMGKSSLEPWRGGVGRFPFHLKAGQGM